MYRKCLSIFVFMVLIVYPLFSEDIRFEVIRSFKSKYLKLPRDIIVMLPEGYDRDLEKYYPVIYAHDGQNLFDPKTSFTGQPWWLQTAITNLVKKGYIKECIVVGIYNTPNRISEYTFSVDPRRGQGGDADNYAKFIIEELMPYIQQRYRVKHDPENVFILGSSLGGLVNLYFGLRYPQYFRNLIVMSPSFWWDNKKILDIISNVDTAKYPELLSLKIYIDAGYREETGDRDNNGLIDMIDDTREVLSALKSKGITNILYYEDLLGSHNEYYWAQRVYIPLLWFLGNPEHSRNLEKIQLFYTPSRVGVGDYVYLGLERTFSDGLKETIVNIDGLNISDKAKFNYLGNGVGQCISNGSVILSYEEQGLSTSITLNIIPHSARFSVIHFSIQTSENPPYPEDVWLEVIKINEQSTNIKIPLIHTKGDVYESKYTFPCPSVVEFYIRSGDNYVEYFSREPKIFKRRIRVVEDTTRVFKVEKWGVFK